MSKNLELRNIYVQTNEDFGYSLAYFDRDAKEYVPEIDNKDEQIFLAKVKAYVFTPDELKELLEKYTDKIIRNVKLNKPDRYGRTTSETYYGEDGDVYVDVESIKFQLPKFLNEIL